MKHINNTVVRIIAAVVIGFLFAGVGTDISYTCTPTDGAAGCASFDKAVLHLGDLIHNKQDSLTHFSVTFAVTSLVVFALLSMLKKKA